jgi:NAD(P)-dependent dehydrogenase (short-subunit alcohol dehydrogenase family)
MDHTVFVTGGAGYIGSHCIVSLLEAGYDVVAIDNFVNSVSETDSAGAQTAPSLDRVQQITGKNLKFMQCDLLDIESLRKVFSQVSLQQNKNLNCKLFLLLVIEQDRQRDSFCGNQGCWGEHGTTIFVLPQ